MHFKTPALVAAWVVTRVWLLLSGFQIIAYPQGENLFADVRLYDWWAGNIQDGHFPINDPMWQYPPLAALVFLLGYLIAPQTIGFVFLATAVDALIFYFLLEAGLESKKRTYLPAVVWVSTAVFMGPVMLGRFDVFPTLFAVLALLFASNSKLFGINAAVGAVLKVWPALLFLSVTRNNLKKSLIWFALTFGSISVALTIWWPNSFSFLIGQKSRGLQIESVGALPYMFVNAFIQTIPIEFRYGAVEVVASGIGFVSLIITLIAILLFGQIIFWRFKGLLDQVSVSEIALYVVLVSMVTSRVLSPQYMVWVFGLLAVVALNPTSNFKKVFSLLAISAFCGQLIYPVLYFGYMEGDLIALIVQSIRIATLIWATYLLWSGINKTKSKSQLIT